MPDYAFMKGVPARQTGWVCECGQELDLVGSKGAEKRAAKAESSSVVGQVDIDCGKCGLGYQLSGAVLAGCSMVGKASVAG